MSEYLQGPNDQQAHVQESFLSDQFWSATCTACHIKSDVSCHRRGNGDTDVTLAELGEGLRATENHLK